MSNPVQESTRLRPLMFSIAYRMLGSVAEAEDIVQDAFVRMQRAPEIDVESPEAYATTVTTRLAIDHLRSARVRREQYVGSWLPEPLLTGGSGDAETDPAHRAELSDTLSVAFLVLMESLSPIERAVFLLRETFGYDYSRIAEIVEKSEANCRQIFARSRQRIAERAPRFEVSEQRRDELMRRFFAACEAGDLAALEEVLAEDVVFYGDGGGKAPAVKHPVEGREQVARFILGIIRQAARLNIRLAPVEVNGEPGGRLVDADGAVLAVFALELDDGLVRGVRNQLNPDKLVHLQR